MKTVCKQIHWKKRHGLLCASLLLSLSVLAVPQSARSDQTAPELPALFDALADTTQPAEAEQIELEIWQYWLQPPDAEAAKLMTQIASAMAGSDFKVAIEINDELVQSHPQFAEGWNRRATLHYMLGNNAQSVADIRKTVSLEPRHFGAISGLGLIFLKEGDEASALKAFEQVLEISPASVSARLSVEQLRQKLGREI